MGAFYRQVSVSCTVLDCTVIHSEGGISQWLFYLICILIQTYVGFAVNFHAVLCTYEYRVYYSYLKRNRMYFESFIVKRLSLDRVELYNLNACMEMALFF